ncbi:DUF2971 domain-containing protein [Aeromonas veronii]|uniref:DUF2971 domain-containing protein n=1 Tax=Aeromonas veronii TaxID=654 RepID=UPI0009561AFA|nr:DUF2971 domain-containing protein [Aeromonas veronii]SIQ00471.1 Protein of unknown function [Aeromonas veronii]
MNILYKYYSDSLDEGYFNDPTMKLSTTPKLNDPFEFSVAKEIKELYKNHQLKNLDSSLSRFFNSIIADCNIELILSSTGVISLTETHRNKLMWAHYANEHKGLAIGYKTDMFDEIDINNLHKDYFCSLQPVKINYDSKRFDYIDKLDSECIEKDLVKKILTTKSDEWIYEKEHRYIIPIQYCDKFLFDKKDHMMPFHFDSLAIHGGPLIKSKESGDYKFNLEHDGLLNTVTASANMNGLSFLKRIDKSKIHSIYLGVRYDRNKQEKLIKILLENKSSLGHVKLYKYEVNPERFELDEKPIPWNN